jgi:hypothetical protein
MSLINKYINTIFDSKFFAEPLFLPNLNTTIYCIKDEESVANFSAGFSVSGVNNKLIIKTADKDKYSIEDNTLVSFNGVSYFVKEIINNNNGTTTLTIEEEV